MLFSEKKSKIVLTKGSWANINTLIKRSLTEEMKKSCEKLFNIVNKIKKLKYNDLSNRNT